MLAHGEMNIYVHGMSEYVVDRWCAILIELTRCLAAIWYSMPDWAVLQYTTGFSQMMFMCVLNVND
jgi:hypothetical protein